MQDRAGSAKGSAERAGGVAVQEALATSGLLADAA